MEFYPTLRHLKNAAGDLAGYVICLIPLVLEFG